jgi:hypothetical protein
MHQSTPDRPDMLMRLNGPTNRPEIPEIKVVEQSIPARGMNSLRSITDLVNQSYAPGIVGQSFPAAGAAEFECTFRYKIGPSGIPPRIEVAGGGDWLKISDDRRGTVTLKGTPPAPPIAPNRQISNAVSYPIRLRISQADGRRVFEKKFTIVAVSKKVFQVKTQKDSRLSEMPTRLATRVVAIEPGSISHTPAVNENRWFSVQNITDSMVRQAVANLPADNVNRIFGEAVIQGLVGWLSADKAVLENLPPIDIEWMRKEIKTRLDPQRTIVERTRSRYRFRFAKPSERARRNELGRELDTIMAAPEFPQPMSEALEEISQELLLRGIEKVPQNTVALLETNRRFVEAFMCGLNHEFSGELLWREYPSDQRGSYFRQFWRTTDLVPDDKQIENAREHYDSQMKIKNWSAEDKSQFAELYRDQLGDPSSWSNPDVFQAVLNLKAIEESLKDIPPLPIWKAERLGQNLNELCPGVGGAEEKLVLMIRGDLLKKYPNTLIYMVKGASNDAVPDLPEYTGATGEIRFPIFSGAAKPDIVFLGFNLTAYDARNNHWYIVLEERCSEMRFGLDIKKSNSDLAWEDFGLINNFEEYIQRGNPSEPSGIWDASAAEIAKLTMQSPVRIAIDAKQLLPL